MNNFVHANAGLSSSDPFDALVAAAAVDSETLLADLRSLGAWAHRFGGRQTDGNAFQSRELESAGGALAASSSDDDSADPQRDACTGNLNFLDPFHGSPGQINAIPQVISISAALDAGHF